MKRLELTIFALVVAMCNIPVLLGLPTETLIYLPEKVLAGQLYRFLTHAFVHVTPYHLILDGTAFFLLYAMLAEASSLKRISYVVSTAIGSLIAVTVVMPTLSSVGYCGLSGIAHGLMAVTSIEMILNKKACKAVSRAGLFSLGIVLAKSIYEAASGNVFFDFMHADNIGLPVAVAHLGGVIGGAVMYVVNNLSVKRAVDNVVLLSTM